LAAEVAGRGAQTEKEPLAVLGVGLRGELLPWVSVHPVRVLIVVALLAMVEQVVAVQGLLAAPM
jgi:hypothetical protein